jgi:UDP-N-acetylmuramate dehydrogenase
MQSLIRRIETISSPEQLLLNESMASHTTIRVGGPADAFYMPESVEQLRQSLDWARSLSVPVLLMGNGSNLIVRDGGVRGLVVALGERFSRIRVEGDELTAQAGASLKRVSLAAQEAGLSGLEFAAGIPGTLGGGTAMNAGAYGGQLSDVLLSADVLLDGEVRTLSLEEMQMGYRTTLPLSLNCPVLSVRFRLTRGDPAAILDRMNCLNLRRRERQPLNYPSAGSVFKRPEGHFAGALIEEAGLKGLTNGGAQVSEKHAGFIINLGGATAKEVLELMEEVRSRVFARSGVMLEPEVRIVGED